MGANHGEMALLALQPAKRSFLTPHLSLPILVSLWWGGEINIGPG